MNRLLKILILFLCLFTNFLFSETKKGQWVHCFGEVAITNLTTEQARDQAIAQARLNAVEMACGIELVSESMIENFMLTSDFIHSFTSGHVVEEKDYKWSTKILSAPDSTAPPVIMMRVDMEARVIKDDFRPDPNFKVTLETNRKTFVSGQELILEIEATQDCYLTVFDIAANDTVYVLFPNLSAREVFLKAGVRISLPDASIRKKNFHLIVETLPGYEKNHETIKVIATKQKLPILEVLDLKAGTGELGTPRFAIWSMARALAQIPMNQRAEATVKILVLAE